MSELILLACCSPFLLFPGPWSVVGFALVAAQIVLRKVRSGHFFPATPFDVPLLLFLCAMLVGAWAAVDAPTAANRLTLLFLGVVAFYTLVGYIRDHTSITQLALLLILLSVCVSVFSLLATQFDAGLIVKSPWFAAHFPAILRGLPGSGVPTNTQAANPRITGSLVYLIPLPLAFLFFAKNGKLKLIGALASAVVAFPVLITQSPQSLLALLVGVGFILLVWKPRWMLVLGGLFAVALLALAPFILSRVPAAVVARLLQGVESRLPVYQSAYRMLRDMPFTGVGLNNFFIVDTLYSPESTLANPITPHAHDLYLQVALDGGVLGLVAFLALFATFFFLILRSMKLIPAPDLRPVWIGLAASAIAYLVFGLPETNTLGHKTSLLMWVMLAMAAGLFKGSARVFPTRFLKPIRWGIALSALLLAMAAGPVVLAGAYANASFFELHRAVLAGPAPDVARMALAGRLARQALACSPTAARVHLVLAETALRTGRVDLAAREFELAVVFDPTDRYAHYRLGERLFWQGKPALAAAQWKYAHARLALYLDSVKLVNAKQYKEAAVWLQAAVLAEPDDERLQIYLKQVLVEVNR